MRWNENNRGEHYRRSRSSFYENNSKYLVQLFVITIYTHTPTHPATHTHTHTDTHTQTKRPRIVCLHCYICPYIEVRVSPYPPNHPHTHTRTFTRRYIYIIYIIKTHIKIQNRKLGLPWVKCSSYVNLMPKYPNLFSRLWSAICADHKRSRHIKNIWRKITVTEVATDALSSNTCRGNFTNNETSFK